MSVLTQHSIYLTLFNSFVISSKLNYFGNAVEERKDRIYLLENDISLRSSFTIYDGVHEGFLFLIKNQLIK